MFKDIIKYNNKKYQVSTVDLNGIFETMIFPIENGVISGNTVYCFRTMDSNESCTKHQDIIYHSYNYISDEAIAKYFEEKEEVSDCEEETSEMEIKLNTAYSSKWDNLEYPILKLADGSYLCIAYSQNHRNHYINVYTKEDFIEQGFEEDEYCNMYYENITKEDIMG